MDHLFENHLWVVIISVSCIVAFFGILVLWIWQLRRIRKKREADNARIINPAQKEFLDLYRKASPQKKASMLKMLQEFQHRNNNLGPSINDLNRKLNQSPGKLKKKRRGKAEGN